jgi:hypothetical protein
MKDLIDIILKNLTGYLPILVSLISTPKQSILTLTADEAERLKKALLFVVITIAIGFALQAPLVKISENFITHAGSMLALKILAFISFSGVIMLAFRLVGGTANYEITLSAYLYIISPLYLILVMLRLISIGIASTHDPEFSRSMFIDQNITSEQYRNFFDISPVAAISSTLISLFQFPIIIIWFALCWGSLRKIHQVSFIRSFLAYLITMILLHLFMILMVFVLKGLYIGGGPAIAQGFVNSVIAG